MMWDETRLRSKLLAAWWSKEKITEGEKKKNLRCNEYDLQTPTRLIKVTKFSI